MVSLLMLVLLSLTNATKIVRHHVTFKIVTVDDVVSRPGGVYALPAPDHRHGGDGGGVIYDIQ